MAILSKALRLARPLISQLGRNQAVTRLVPNQPFLSRHLSTWQLYKTRSELLCSTSSKTFVTYPTVYQAINDESMSFDIHTMPVVDMMDVPVLEKLQEYATIRPTPISIEEFIAMGRKGAVTEEESYNHLKNEVAVRLDTFPFSLLVGYLQLIFLDWHT